MIGASNGLDLGTASSRSAANKGMRAAAFISRTGRQNEDRSGSSVNGKGKLT